MSTLRVNTLQNTAGTGQPAMVGAAKAWVNFNGTGTVAIRAAFNVSSITDNGTGDYTANFTSALEDANYSQVVSARNTASIVVVDPISEFSTTSLCRLQVGNLAGALVDSQYLHVAIFR